MPTVASPIPFQRPAVSPSGITMSDNTDKRKNTGTDEHGRDVQLEHEKTDPEESRDEEELTEGKGSPRATGRGAAAAGHRTQVRRSSRRRPREYEPGSPPGRGAVQQLNEARVEAIRVPPADNRRQLSRGQLLTPRFSPSVLPIPRVSPRSGRPERPASGAFRRGRRRPASRRRPCRPLGRRQRE